MKNTYTSPKLEITVIDLDIITSSRGVETPEEDLGFGDW